MGRTADLLRHDDPPPSPIMLSIRIRPLRSALLGTVLAAAALAPLALSAPLQAQDVSACWLARGTAAEAQSRPSPLAAVAIPLGGEEDAQLCYSRPSARGRTIMGGLVPFGQIWRTGANEATQLHLPEGGQVGGVDLEPGVYSLYTIPGEDEWEIVLNRNYQRWGIPVSPQVRAEDVGSFTRAATRTDDMVEQLTIRWDAHGTGMGHLVLEWEHTHVEIPIHSMAMAHD